jgi:hypothetical protein
MFFALGRLVFILLVVATIAYVCLWYYLRAAQRERLEQAWEEAGRPGSRELFVQEGLDSERYALRRRLLLGVYVVPFAIVAVVVYIANYA